MSLVKNGSLISESSEHEDSSLASWYHIMHLPKVGVSYLIRLNHVSNGQLPIFYLHVR